MSDHDSEKLEQPAQEINHQIEVTEGGPQGDNRENITDNPLDAKAKKGEGTVSGILLLQPLVKSGYSLMPDIKEGWKPEKKDPAPPIPLRFKDIDMDRLEISVPIGYKPYRHTDTVLYYGFRPEDSIVMHSAFIRIFKGGLTQSSYPFCFPP